LAATALKLMRNKCWQKSWHSYAHPTQFAPIQARMQKRLTV